MNRQKAGPPVSPERSGFFYLLCGVFLAFPAASARAYTQLLVPVVRDISSSSPSVSTWNAFVPVLEEKGCTYAALSQVSALMEGTLHWHSVTHSVDLTLHGHVANFSEDSRRALLDGQPHTLPCKTLKNDQGFWVPISFFASPSYYRHTRTRLLWPPAAESAAGEVKKAPAVRLPAPAVAVQPTAPPVDVPVSAPAAEVPIRSESTERRAIHRIVIDPGHGGKDPGTQGPHGIEEKTLNLLIAQTLADALRAEGYEVLLTRTDDTFIPLDGRTRLANKYSADLFVSIHCNASLSAKLKGFEVYFLSESASDPHADAVARLENAPLALEGKAAPTPDQVQAVLRSLVKTAYINESSELGALVDRQVGEGLSEPRLGVKQAAFYVLRGAEMPSILIEVGFLSNPKEERLLQQPRFQKKLVQGIVKGINAYDARKKGERPR